MSWHEAIVGNFGLKTVDKVIETLHESDVIGTDRLTVLTGIGGNMQGTPPPEYLRDRAYFLGWAIHQALDIPVAVEEVSPRVGTDKATSGRFTTTEPYTGMPPTLWREITSAQGRHREGTLNLLPANADSAIYDQLSFVGLIDPKQDPETARQFNYYELRSGSIVGLTKPPGRKAKWLPLSPPIPYSETDEHLSLADQITAEFLAPRPIRSGRDQDNLTVDDELTAELENGRAVIDLTYTNQHEFALAR